MEKSLNEVVLPKDAFIKLQPSSLSYTQWILANTYLLGFWRKLIMVRTANLLLHAKPENINFLSVFYLKHKKEGVKSPQKEKVRPDFQDNSVFCFQLLSIPVGTNTSKEISFHVDIKYRTWIDIQHLPAGQHVVAALQLYPTACLLLLKIWFRCYKPSTLGNVSHSTFK